MMERVWIEEQRGQPGAGADTAWSLARAHDARDARQRALHCADYAAAQRSRTFTMATTLRLATTIDEIRASVQRFNDEAKTWEYARQLARATVYWVYDARTGCFGPSKFVAFAGITPAGYDDARKHNATGAYFDGGATRRAIERVVGEIYQADQALAEKLVRWGQEAFGEAVFAGVDPGRWRFVGIG